jgi:hypothetical protein
VNSFHVLEVIHTYIPQIHKFIIATTGCEISHKDTKHTDKFSNNKTTQKQNDETMDKYVFKSCEDKTNKRAFNIKVYTYYTRSIQHTVA